VFFGVYVFFLAVWSLSTACDAHHVWLYEPGVIRRVSSDRAASERSSSLSAFLLSSGSLRAAPERPARSSPPPSGSFVGDLGGTQQLPLTALWWRGSWRFAGERTLDRGVGEDDRPEGSSVLVETVACACVGLVCCRYAPMTPCLIAASQHGLGRGVGFGGLLLRCGANEGFWVCWQFGLYLLHVMRIMGCTQA